jgi:hypothetical protein
MEPLLPVWLGTVDAVTYLKSRHQNDLRCFYMTNGDNMEKIWGRVVHAQTHGNHYDGHVTCATFLATEGRTWRQTMELWQMMERGC